MIGGIHTGLEVAAIALLIDAVLTMAYHLAPTTNATTARTQIHYTYKLLHDCLAYVHLLVGSLATKQEQLQCPTCLIIIVSLSSSWCLLIRISLVRLSGLFLFRARAQESLSFLLHLSSILGQLCYVFKSKLLHCGPWRSDCSSR